jgi:hypothetical protein
VSVRPTFSLACTGDSTITGRLSSDIVPRLAHDLPLQPEAVGPILIHNMGMGSQTSVWGVTNAPLISARKPTHIISGGFELNGCVDFGGGPAVTRSNNILNIQAMVAEWQANIPGVDITLQTMNSVSAAVAAIRPNLTDYCADTIATGTTLGVRTLDHYAAWPKPLPDLKSYYGAIGYTAWGGTWNPADKNANIALSGGNLIATGGGVDNSVRGTVGFAAGSHYFDVLMTNGVGPTVGVMTAAAGIANGQYVGATAGGAGYGFNGRVFLNGALVGFLEPYTTGDIIGCFHRGDLNKVWWSKNGTWVNGDPVQGIGGIDLTPGTYYPAVSLSAGNVVSVNFATVFPGDGLHPIWGGAVDTYTYPALLAHCRMLMDLFW